MYSIEKKQFGCILTLSGIINQEEMSNFCRDALIFLESTQQEFGALVDMRELQPISNAARKEIDKAQRAARDAGMTRSVVILSSPVIKRQFEEIAKETGVLEWERYIDASATLDWEQVALDWIEKAIDPETRQKDQKPA